MKEDGRFEMLTKKERLQMDRELEGLMKNLAGIKDMRGLPDMIFIIDVRKEDIAVKEANRLGIPIVAVVDTNCSPEGITQVIPGNDDALRAIRLFASRIADAILEGRQVGTEGNVAVSSSNDEDANDAGADLDPTILVADKSFHSAEDTNTASEPRPAAGAFEVAGASGDAGTEVRSQYKSSDASDAIADISTTQQSQQTGEERAPEESTEATAS